MGFTFNNMPLDITIKIDKDGCNIYSKAMKCSYYVKEENLSDEVSKLVEEFLTLSKDDE